jgi:SAM-dependent methyltransferase
MNAEATSQPNSAVPPLPASIQPHDLLAEGARARKLSAEVEGVKCLLEGTRLVNDAILVQVLFALWDSGFYEYSLSHPRFHVQAAADELHLDASTLQWLLEYLVGRGIIEAADGNMALTENGIRLSNVLLRGTINLYVGGWGPQLDNIGPLLRKEIRLADYRNLRSQRHTVMGTEQLSSVRTGPAVLKFLKQKDLRGVLHLACRTGQFLIELARSEPSIYGAGIDKAAERIAAALTNARAWGVESRLRFFAAEVGHDALPRDDESIGKIDVVIALYLFHEVARHGRQAVVAMLRQIKEAYPGRLLLFMETLPYEAPPRGKKPPQTFTQLDYLLIHRVRVQGLPLSSDVWKSILEEASLKLREVQEVYGSGMYLVEL